MFLPLPPPMPPATSPLPAWDTHTSLMAVTTWLMAVSPPTRMLHGGRYGQLIRIAMETYFGEAATATLTSETGWYRKKLQALAKRHGLKANGKSADLIDGLHRTLQGARDVDHSI